MVENGSLLFTTRPITARFESANSTSVVLASGRRFSMVLYLFEGFSIVCMADIFSMIFNRLRVFCMPRQVYFFQDFFNVFRFFSIGPAFVSMLLKIGTF
jgi:hypothetical protein